MSVASECQPLDTEITRDECSVPLTRRVDLSLQAILEEMQITSTSVGCFCSIESPPRTALSDERLRSSTTSISCVSDPQCQLASEAVPNPGLKSSPQTKSVPSLHKLAVAPSRIKASKFSLSTSRRRFCYITTELPRLQYLEKN